MSSYMTNKPNDFVKSAKIAMKDEQLRTALGRTTANVRVAYDEVFAELEDERAIRQQGREAKLRALHDLPHLLERAEKKIIDNGGTVLWAIDGDEANQHVLDICSQHDLKHGVKAKSMVTEEIELLPMLEKHGIEVVETDLGEYIVQVSDDRPSHVVMPAMHLTKESIRDLLMDKADMPYAETAEEMTAFARDTLRDKYLQADFGMSGGNFLIAETGHLVIVTNEGNGRMSTGIPPVHIALVGIEKVIPTWEDFLTLLQLLTRAATGQRLSVYVNIMSAAARADDSDGPRHFYLILLDNGRSDIYDSEYAEALACIRCGACLNICPVFTKVGGHAYGGVYPGPIGSVITPLLNGKDNAHPLPFASSLCGACKEACPINIDLPDMLLKLRRDLQHKQKPVWKAMMKGFGIGFSNPTLYNAGGKFASKVASGKGEQDMLKTLPYPLNGWTQNRDFPALAKQRFRDWWKENRDSDADQ
jgi:L-lactate dehydrogenase complex protein LldF